MIGSNFLFIVKQGNNYCPFARMGNRTLEIIFKRADACLRDERVDISNLDLVQQEMRRFSKIKNLVFHPYLTCYCVARSVDPATSKNRYLVVLLNAGVLNAEKAPLVSTIEEAKKDAENKARKARVPCISDLLIISDRIEVVRLFNIRAL